MDGLLAPTRIVPLAPRATLRRPAEIGVQIGEPDDPVELERRPARKYRTAGAVVEDAPIAARMTVFGFSAHAMPKRGSNWMRERLDEAASPST